MGGMGNQMFQYAFGRYLSVKHNTTLKLDLSILLDRTPRKDFVFRDYDLGIFDIEENFASEKEISAIRDWSPSPLLKKILKKIRGIRKNYIREPFPNFSGAVYHSPDNVFLDGYWQTEKYFQDIEDIIKKEFVVKEHLSEQALMLANQIRKNNSVCVNVRRGDFILNSYHNVCDLRYYRKAEAIISSKIQDPYFYIFSDDIEWCRENLGFYSPATYVSHEFAGKKFQDYLRLMSYCKHFIIPNSSFAWWAAYLSPSQNNIVIAPQKWVADDNYNEEDVYRKNWIRI